MENIILIIRELQGILGAILGSVTTLIVSDMLRKKGKLKIYLIDWQGKYETFKEAGCYSDKKDTDFYDYNFHYTLQVYNKSDIPKIMRNFKVKFYKGKKEVFMIIPSDETTKRFGSNMYFVDNAEVINIKPKEILVLKHSGYIDYKELNFIEESSKVELTYYDEKDKKRTIMLYEGIISKNNYVSTS